MIDKEGTTGVSLTLATVCVREAPLHRRDVVVSRDAVAWLGVAFLQHFLTTPVKTGTKLIRGQCTWRLWQVGTTDTRGANGGFGRNAKGHTSGH